MGTRLIICKSKTFAKRVKSPMLRLPLQVGHAMNASPEMQPDDVMRVKLEVLRREHRDLDDAIHALQEKGTADMLTLKRLKKQKQIGRASCRERV